MAGWIGIGFAVFLVLGLIGTFARGDNQPTAAILPAAIPTTTPATTSADRTPAQGTVATNTFPATTAKPRPKPKPRVVLSVSGHGSHTHATRKFTVTDDWELHWSYKATGLFAGDSVNFVLTVEDPDADFSAADVNELDTHGAGVEEYSAYGKGTFWISVISEGSWTLKVVDVPEGCMLDSPPSC